MEFGEMKDRIAHIIRAKNLNAAEFAAQLGIQPSNISHLLSGRNNPSLEFVKKLKESFPEYNLDWIIFGTGSMTVSTPFQETRTQNGIQTVGNQKDVDNSLLLEFPTPSLTETGSESQSEAVNTSSARLKQVLFVFDDHTFEVFEPR